MDVDCGRARLSAVCRAVTRGHPLERGVAARLGAHALVVHLLPRARLRHLVHRRAAAGRDPHLGLQQSHPDCGHGRGLGVARGARDRSAVGRGRGHPRWRVPDAPVAGGVEARIQRLRGVERRGVRFRNAVGRLEMSLCQTPLQSSTRYCLSSHLHVTCVVT